MLVQNLYQPFEIDVIESDVCPIKPHTHTFFEMVYLLSGAGICHINNQTYRYGPDNMFLIKAGDVHYTEVEQLTTFVFIRFNALFIESHAPATGAPYREAWIEQLRSLNNGLTSQGKVLGNSSDKRLVKVIIESLVSEHRAAHPVNLPVTEQLIATLIALLCRNNLRQMPQGGEGNLLILSMISYIEKNIHEPAKLKVETIASTFFMSEKYVGEFFKKHTGESLQQFIMKQKIKQVELRLLHSSMLLKEIAFELGFTDESHLTRAFKKSKGVNPTEFRRSRLVPLI